MASAQPCTKVARADHCDLFNHLTATVTESENKMGLCVGDEFSRIGTHFIAIRRRVLPCLPPCVIAQHACMLAPLSISDSAWSHDYWLRLLVHGPPFGLFYNGNISAAVHEFAAHFILWRSRRCPVRSAVPASIPVPWGKRPEGALWGPEDAGITSAARHCPSMLSAGGRVRLTKECLTHSCFLLNFSRKVILRSTTPRSLCCLDCWSSTKYWELAGEDFGTSVSLAQLLSCSVSQ